MFPRDAMNFYASIKAYTETNWIELNVGAVQFMSVAL